MAASKDSLKASVIIVTYNHDRYICDCLESVLANSPFQIIVIDNSSSDSTVEKIKTRYDGRVEVVIRPNGGFGKGCNEGAKLAIGNILVFLNPDTRVEKGWLEGLTSPFSKQNVKTVAIPRIMQYSGLIVNTIGNIEHYCGLGFLNGNGENWEAFNSIKRSIKGLSGACFAMRKDEFLSIGGFDENRFFCYLEDVDLSWRCMENGFSFFFSRESIVNHDYSPSMTPFKMRSIEEGRYLLLSKHYSRRNILSIAPALLLIDAMMMLQALQNDNKSLKFKIAAMWTGWQRMLASDGVNNSILSDLDYRIPENAYDISNSARKAIKIANWLLEINWRMASR